METRIGVVSILITDKHVVATVNQLLSEFGEIILGRIGVPYREKGLNVIALIVDGTTDKVGALTGRLGALDGVTTRTSLLTK